MGMEIAVTKTKIVMTAMAVTAMAMAVTAMAMAVTAMAMATMDTILLPTTGMATDTPMWETNQGRLLPPLLRTLPQGSIKSV
jgi:hypothetical protein